jgi:hypothetical protein
MDDCGGEAPSIGGGVCEVVVSEVGITLKVLILFGDKGGGLFNIVFTMEDLLNVGGREGANITHAGSICADQEEKVTSASQLIAQLNQAGGHPIQAVRPELVYKFLSILITYFDIETGPDHILTG